MFKLSLCLLCCVLVLYCTSSLGPLFLLKETNTSWDLCLCPSPEPAQDDHGRGERDQRGAVAHGVQSLHRHVVLVLKRKHEHIKKRPMRRKWNSEPSDSPCGCCFPPRSGRRPRSAGRCPTSRTRCSCDSPSPALWTHGSLFDYTERRFILRVKSGKDGGSLMVMITFKSDLEEHESRLQTKSTSIYLCCHDQLDICVIQLCLLINACRNSMQHANMEQIWYFFSTGWSIWMCLLL